MISPSDLQSATNKAPKQIMPSAFVVWINAASAWSIIISAIILIDIMHGHYGPYGLKLYIWLKFITISASMWCIYCTNAVYSNVELLRMRHIMALDAAISANPISPVEPLVWPPSPFLNTDKVGEYLQVQNHFSQRLFKRNIVKSILIVFVTLGFIAGFSAVVFFVDHASLLFEIIVPAVSLTVCTTITLHHTIMLYRYKRQMFIIFGV